MRVRNKAGRNRVYLKAAADDLNLILIWCMVYWPIVSAVLPLFKKAGTVVDRVARHSPHNPS